jgi:uncharacterized protein (DUF2235 family)
MFRAFSERLKSMPRNIVVCCDGTGNEFGECNSNVVKFYTALTINNDQIGYYHPGLGTMGSPTARTRLGRKWSTIKGLAFGAGFLDNVADAYRYLMDRYNDGDHIYLVGFSRGSYTVRALGAILHAYGLLCRGNEGHIPYMIKMFMDDAKEMRKRGRSSLPVRGAFKETYSRNVILRFVGVWDTVSSIGWVYEPVRLLYLAQNPSIQTGRHAVSIDERRSSFRANLWGEALPTHKTPDLIADQDIFQAWFAGVHSDVGGSYPQAETALSNGALRWLLGEAIAAGAMVEPDRINMLFGLDTDEEHAAARLYSPPPPQPGIKHESLHGPWWLLEIIPHRFYSEDDGKERWGIPFGKSRKVPRGSFIHPSVVERMENRAADYNPRNLPHQKLTPIGNLTGDDQRFAAIKTQADVSQFYVYTPTTTTETTAQTSNLAATVR